MPLNSGKQVILRDSYCSAPPLTTTPRLLLPPRLPSRAEEARRPRAPLARPIKREVRESETESVEFVVDDEDVDLVVKQEVKIKPDPRQLSVRIAAIAIRPASTTSTSSKEAQGPFVPEYRTQPLCRVPSGQLGPAATT